MRSGRSTKISSREISSFKVSLLSNSFKAFVKIEKQHSKWISLWWKCIFTPHNFLQVFRIIGLQFLKIDSQVANCEMLIQTLTYSCCVRQSQCLENVYTGFNNFLGGFWKMSDFFYRSRLSWVHTLWDWPPWNNLPIKSNITMHLCMMV